MDIERMDVELRELDPKLKQMQQNTAAYKRGTELHEKRGQLLADQLRNLRPRRLYDRFEFSAKGVAAGWIAPLGCEVRKHGLQNFGRYRRRCVMVQINHQLSVINMPF